MAGPCIGSAVVAQTARALVLATGARGYVQPVPEWRTPGGLGLAGVTARMRSEQIPPGQAPVVSGTGPVVCCAASEVRRLDSTVVAVVMPNNRRD